MPIDIREARKILSISQSQFSEISGIPQHKLSMFELGKESPSTCEADLILEAFSQIHAGQLNIRRKRRISKEVFSSSIIEDRERRGYSVTTRNVEYLNELRMLEYRFHLPSKSDYTAVSFFAGCGGLCYGLRSAGFKIVASNELVDEYRDIYKSNFHNAKFLSNDIKDVSDEEISAIKREYPSIDLLAGGPPCQGFSLAGKRDVNDSRNTLFQYYLRIAEQLKPKVILMENVKLLTSMKTPNGRLVKDEIINYFAQIGYQGRFFVVNAADYGVPQNRYRVIFIGIRNDLGWSPQIAEPLYGDTGDLFGKPAYFTFGDAVSDLDYLESGEVSSKDCLHRAVKHPEHVLRWLFDVPQGKSAHDNEDPSLRPPSGYNTTYKRQVWNQPGCTVTTNYNMISGCNNVHPIATRALTTREAMRLQSFPDSFKMEGKEEVVRTVVGNAVPPLMAFHLANDIISRYL